MVVLIYLKHHVSNTGLLYCCNVTLIRADVTGRLASRKDGMGHKTHTWVGVFSLFKRNIIEVTHHNLVPYSRDFALDVAVQVRHVSCGVDRRFLDHARRPGGLHHVTRHIENRIDGKNNTQVQKKKHGMHRKIMRVQRERRAGGGGKSKHCFASAGCLSRVSDQQWLVNPCWGHTFFNTDVYTRQNRQNRCKVLRQANQLCQSVAMLDYR